MSSKDDPTMIDEDELEAMLRTEAHRYGVPASGADAVRSSVITSNVAPEPRPSVSWFAQTNGSRGEHKVAWALGAVAALVVVALLIGNLSGRGDNPATTADRASLPKSGQKSADLSPSSAGNKALAFGSASGSVAGSRSPATTTPTATNKRSGGALAQAGTPEKIVKTGSIEVEVARHTFSAKIARLTGIVNGLGGFVAETDTSEQGAAPAGTISLRVPADRFEQLLVAARGLGKVRSATTGSKDVTSEYTDITGRLKTMRDERDSLGLVLIAAKNVPDILAVRDRLNSVQAEIEQLTGRRQVLEDRAALATLTVSVSEPAVAAPPPHRPKIARRSGLVRAWHDAVDGFTGGVEAILAGSGKVLLVLLCGAALWLIGLPLWRRVRRSIV